MSEEIQKRDRAVSARVQDRLDILKEKLATKNKRSQIIEYIRDQHAEWRVSVGTIDSYIKKARIQLIEESTQTRAMLKCEAATDLRYIYSKAIEEKDWTVALRARIELSKLYSLHGNDGMLQAASGGEKDVTPLEVQEHLNDVFKQELLEVTNPPDSGAVATAVGAPMQVNKVVEGSKFADLGL